MWCSRALGVFLQITKARNNLAQSYRLVVVVEKRDRERVRGSTVFLNLAHFRILFFCKNKLLFLSNVWFEFSLQSAKLWMENTDLGNQEIRVCILMKTPV